MMAKSGEEAAAAAAASGRLGAKPADSVEQENRKWKKKRETQSEELASSHEACKRLRQQQSGQVATCTGSCACRPMTYRQFLPLIVFSLLALAARNNANQDVIPATAFNGPNQRRPAEARLLEGGTGQTRTKTPDGQQQQAPAESNRNQFKYHLNHLRPPSLVPITIQQLLPGTPPPASSPVGLGRQQQQQHQQQHQLGIERRLAPDNQDQERAADRIWTQASGFGAQRPTDLQAAASSLKPEGYASERANFVQLQLPLQLHLKLRPLPLPLPPPPAPAGNLAMASTNSTNEKRRRSLREETPSTTLAAELQPEVAPANLSMVERKRELTHLSWQEAKRILLLGAMSPVLAHGKFELSAGSLPLESHFEAPSSSFLDGDNRRQPSYLLETPAGGLIADSAPTTMPPTTTASSTTTTTEVRRQRHNSQQNLQGQMQTSDQADTPIQAMAAAMLPLFWPSFQLSAGPGRVSPANTMLDSNRKSSTLSELATISHERSRLNDAKSLQTNLVAQTMNSSLDSREHHQASSQLQPMHVNPTNLPEVVMSAQNYSTDKSAIEREALSRAQIGPIANTTARARRKRRRPIYLTPAAALGNSYPDSTRMASKYPMPRIKYKPQGETVATTEAVTTTISPTTTTRGTPEPKQSVKSRLVSKKQIPKSLSKIIEQQLLLNATGLLMEHKSRQANRKGESSMAPPTTSVRKVVRLKSDLLTTETPIRVEKMATTTSDYSRELMGRRRASALTTTTTSGPVFVTTTPAPQATSSLASGEISSDATIQPQPTTELTFAATSAARTTPLPVTSQAASASPRRRQVAEPTAGTESVSFETTTMKPTTTTAFSWSPREIEVVSHGPPPTTTVAPTSTTSTIGHFKRSTTTKPVSLLGPRKRVTSETNSFAGVNRKNNIKLFHFKRKPDMKKLPFYRKPLNYTELGWTPEQIQEHLEATGFLFNGSAGGGGSAHEEASGETEQDLTGGPKITEEGSLLKRKRRGGKNQFERLMAELHGQQPPEVVNELSAGLMIDRSESSAGGLAVAEDLVPVLKKKEEPFVLKPMFFVMNQKRQRVPVGNLTKAELEEANSLSATPSTSPSTITSSTTSRSSTESSLELAQNRSKPIIRMRRKHNGGEPILLTTNQQPWRPSKPLWSSAIVLSSQRDNQRPEVGQSPLAGERIMFVPSSLLTPSGSHLVPLYTSGGGGGSVPSWSAIRQDYNEPFGAGPQEVSLLAKQSATLSWQPDKSSAGLAPSGDESFLLAPSGVVSPELAERTQASKGSSAAAVDLTPRGNQTSRLAVKVSPSSESGELRVPKLLSKPMRPAKYSLNGYIPKPSLSQQQQQQQQLISQVLQPQQTSAVLQTTSGGPQIGNSKLLNQSATGVNKQRAKLKAHQQVAGPALTGANGNGKDLDSSTSNEIFSRRRGLQQHHRSVGHPAPAGQSSSFNSLIASLINANLTPPATSKQTTDENKKRYLAKQQQLQLANRSPTLTAQKVNQIKAKLGLTIVNGAGATNKPANLNKSTTSNGPLAASTNTVSISSPDNQDGQQSTSISELPNSDKMDSNNFPDKSKLKVGAPLNSIPKTDFECTDRKGRFVSGLFADHKTGCQVWHLCSNNRKYSFLCPAGTIFNEKVRICDWRYNAKCEAKIF